ncbi:uncharacterized protein LOC119016390 isoform X3 [Acanthopagrus latus]|uniref:uncharacterized protein LOC119016390 isoform X3 n=1 Tax=Acanthopagrus latus TaxID=8177 RepID=UPI00187C4F5A|nr:uncharacterized protein LOC119016390 isoform X3 [Acanthopagrus latus]
MLPHGAFVDRTGGDLYLDKVTEHDSGSYLCTVESLVGVQDCEVILSFTAPPTVNYRHVAVGVGVTVTVLIIIAIIAATCYCRKKNDEEFSNETLQDELPPRTWLAKNHESVVSWPLESCRGSAQEHWVVMQEIDRWFQPENEESEYEVMAALKPLCHSQKEKSEEAGSIAHRVTVHAEAMEHWVVMQEIDRWFQPENEESEYEVMAALKPKEKSEEAGSIAHRVTVHAEAMLCHSQKEKSEEAGSIAHGVTVHDEAMHKPMKKDVSETDVCHSDGERQIQSTNLMMRHEKDEELCFSQKDNSEFGSSEHNATSRGEAVEQKAKSEIGSGDNHVMAHGEAMPKEE